MREIESIDKGKLIARLARELPGIRERFSLAYSALEAMTGIGAGRLAAIESGRQEMRWHEYLSIIFVLWSNDAGKGVLEEKGLFPPELRRAFSVNRTAHMPEVKREGA